MAEQKFSDYAEARKRLADMGIAEGQWIELFDLLDTVTNTDIVDIRNNQFHDDAFDLLVGIQSATDKKVKQTTAFLRRFAEHIVAQVCSNESPEKVRDIVDHLPQMVKLEKEDEAAL